MDVMILEKALIYTVAIVVGLGLYGWLLGIGRQLAGNVLATVLNAKASMFIINWLTFVGVIHHELSHALFAFVTGAKIINIDIFKPSGGSLGSVTYATRGNVVIRAIQSTLASIAPMITGVFSEYLLYRIWVNNLTEYWQYGLIGYIMVSIALHMSLSGADIKSCLKGLPICVILLYIGILIKFQIG